MGKSTLLTWNITDVWVCFGNGSVQVRFPSRWGNNETCISPFPSVEIIHSGCCTEESKWYYILLISIKSKQDKSKSYFEERLQAHTFCLGLKCLCLEVPSSERAAGPDRGLFCLQCCLVTVNQPRRFLTFPTYYIQTACEKFYAEFQNGDQMPKHYCLEFTFPQTLMWRTCLVHSWTALQALECCKSKVVSIRSL